MVNQSNPQQLFGKDYFKERKFEDKTYYMAQQWISLLRPATAYDYGCGEGCMVHTFNYLGVPTKGYDISEYAINNAYGLSKDKISTSKCINTFDLVMCLDVLEHIPSTQEDELLKTLVANTNKYILLSICDTMLSKRYIDSTHINIRPRKYWEYKLSKLGLKKIELPTNWMFREQLYLYEK